MVDAPSIRRWSTVEADRYAAPIRAARTERNYESRQATSTHAYHVLFRSMYSYPVLPGTVTTGVIACMPNARHDSNTNATLKRDGALSDQRYFRCDARTRSPSERVLASGQCRAAVPAACHGPCGHSAGPSLRIVLDESPANPLSPRL